LPRAIGQRYSLKERIIMMEIGNVPANGLHQLSDSQRALNAAWQIVSRFTPDAARRRKTRTRAPDGFGKASQKAAALAGVSARLVECGRAVINHGIRELQQAVQTGMVTVSDAAKAAKLSPWIQEQALGAVSKGRVKTLAAAVERLVWRGYEDQLLTQAITTVGQLLRERRNLYGSHEEERRADQLLDQLRATITRWRASGPHAPLDAIRDAQSRMGGGPNLAAFHTGSQLAAISRTLGDLAHLIELLARTPGGQLLRIGSDAGLLRQVSQALMDACPAETCPCCRNSPAHCPTCPACGGKGWLPITRC
jgi:hypothetical protein